MHALFFLGSSEELQGAKVGERETKVSFLDATFDRIGVLAIHAWKT